MKYLVSYGATALVFFALDFIWLSTATPFYRERLGELLLEKPNLQVAGLFYLVYVGGVVVCVLGGAPSLDAGAPGGFLVGVQPVCAAPAHRRLQTSTRGPRRGRRG